MTANFAAAAANKDSCWTVPSNLSIALISPNEKRRAAAAESACTICEFSSYLTTPSDRARLSQLRYDVIMVDIDDDTENALKLVESLSSSASARVLVYSSESSLEKLTRSMHAGARDFLAFPFQPEAMTQALRRFADPRAAR